MGNAKGATPEPAPGPIHKVLYRLSVFAAYAGGAIVSSIGLMSATHIILELTTGRGILGEFEVVQFGIAAAAALFFPYCQVRGGHIIVDFFTQRASKATLSRLDAFGCLVMAVMMLLIGWRTLIALPEVYGYGETTTLRQIPLWIAYASMAPGFILAGLVALAQALGVMRPVAAQSDAV